MHHGPAPRKDQSHPACNAGIAAPSLSGDGAVFVAHDCQLHEFYSDGSMLRSARRWYLAARIAALLAIAFACYAFVKLSGGAISDFRRPPAAAPVPAAAVERVSTSQLRHTEGTTPTLRNTVTGRHPADGNRTQHFPPLIALSGSVRADLRGAFYTPVTSEPEPPPVQQMHGGLFISPSGAPSCEPSR